jgi:hypothetical protein
MDHSINSREIPMGKHLQTETEVGNDRFSLTRMPDLKDRLDVASRLGAILLIVLYVCGFLVVSFHNASRGIVTFGLFRARVLSAGVLFSFLVSLALLEWIRAFEVWSRPKSPHPTEQPVSATKFGAGVYSFLKRLFSFFVSALTTAYILSFVVFHGEFVGKVLLFYICWAAVVATVFTLTKQISRRPVLGSVIYVVVLTGAMAGVVLLKEWDTLAMLGWFGAVGTTADFVRKEIRGKDIRGMLDINWAWVLVYLIGVCSYFGAVLYPKIQATLGGGQPTKAVFQFAGQSPIDGLAKDELWLFDEADTGYYVLRTPEEHKAVFVPRSLVSAIYFESGQGTAPPNAAPSAK